MTRRLHRDTEGIETSGKEMQTRPVAPCPSVIVVHKKTRIHGKCTDMPFKPESRCGRATYGGDDGM